MIHVGVVGFHLGDAVVWFLFVACKVGGRIVRIIVKSRMPPSAARVGGDRREKRRSLRSPAVEVDVGGAEFLEAKLGMQPSGRRILRSDVQKRRGAAPSDIAREEPGETPGQSLPLMGGRVVISPRLHSIPGIRAGERKALNLGLKVTKKVRNASILWMAMTLGSFAVAEEAGNARVCKPTVVGDEMVESTESIADAGKRVLPAGLVGSTGFDWNDTQIGVIKDRNGDHVFFASDGSCHAHCNAPNERDGSITRTVGNLSNPLGGERPLETILPSDIRLPPYMIYVGGGPVYQIPDDESGERVLLLVYQAARASYASGYRYPDCDSHGFCNAHQNGFYSYLGLATSSDDGRHWENRGLIVSANAPYDPQLTFDIGNGGLIEERSERGGRRPGKYFYLFFPDLLQGKDAPATPTTMSVARVSYPALTDAVLRHTALPQFMKYDRGAWTEKGLGGRSTDLLPTFEHSGTHQDMSVAWSEYSKRYVAILDDTHAINYLESGDLLHWSPATPLPTTINPNEDVAKYATPIGHGRDPNTLGKEFSVYYNFQDFYGGGFATVQLRRLLVDCR